LVEDKRRFEECQGFWSAWPFRIALLLAAVSTAFAVFDEGLRVEGMIGLAVLGSVALLARVFPMTTVVDDSGIHVRFGPGFLGKRWPLAEVAQAKVVRYAPLREFGGWGYRIGRGGTRAWTVRGRDGVESIMRDGRTVVIGSSRAQDLEAAIRPALP